MMTEDGDEGGPKLFLAAFLGIRILAFMVVSVSVILLIEKC